MQNIGIKASIQSSNSTNRMFGTPLISLNENCLALSTITWCYNCAPLILVKKTKYLHLGDRSIICTYMGHTLGCFSPSISIYKLFNIGAFSFVFRESVFMTFLTAQELYKDIFCFVCGGQKT